MATEYRDLYKNEGTWASLSSAHHVRQIAYITDSFGSYGGASMVYWDGSDVPRSFLTMNASGSVQSVIGTTGFNFSYYGAAGNITLININDYATSSIYWNNTNKDFDFTRPIRLTENDAEGELILGTKGTVRGDTTVGGLLIRSIGSGKVTTGSGITAGTFYFDDIAGKATVNIDGDLDVENIAAAGNVEISGSNYIKFSGYGKIYYNGSTSVIIESLTGRTLTLQTNGTMSDPLINVGSPVQIQNYFGFLPPSSGTVIATRSITLPAPLGVTGSSYIKIDPQIAEDYLDTIVVTNINDGDILIIKSTINTYSIILTELGNMYLGGKNVIIRNKGDRVVLQYDSLITKWVMLSKEYGIRTTVEAGSESTVYTPATNLLSPLGESYIRVERGYTIKKIDTTYYKQGDVIFLRPDETAGSGTVVFEDEATSPTTGDNRLICGSDRTLDEKDIIQFILGDETGDKVWYMVSLADNS